MPDSAWTSMPFCASLTLAFVALVIPFDRSEGLQGQNIAVFFFVFKGRHGVGHGSAESQETAAQTLSTDREKQGNSQPCAQPDRVSRDTRSSSEGTRNSKVV